MRPALALLVVLLVAAPARAEPRNAAYLELLGKGGYWAAGVERAHGRWGAGLAFSATWLRHERILSLSPYLLATVAARGRHAWFAHAGPSLVEHAIRSTVPEWDGARDRGIAAQVTSGWELRGPVLVRASVSLIAGPGGLVPWLGVAGGVRW